MYGGGALFDFIVVSFSFHDGGLFVGGVAIAIDGVFLKTALRLDIVSTTNLMKLSFYNLFFILFPMMSHNRTKV